MRSSTYSKSGIENENSLKNEWTLYWFFIQKERCSPPPPKYFIFFYPDDDEISHKLRSNNCCFIQTNFFKPCKLISVHMVGEQHLCLRKFAIIFKFVLKQLAIACACVHQARWRTTIKKYSKSCKSQKQRGAFESTVCVYDLRRQNKSDKKFAILITTIRNQRLSRNWWSPGYQTLTFETLHKKDSPPVQFWYSYGSPVWWV